MKWDQKMKSAKLLGIIGLLSGATTLILMLVVGDTFGFPGSAEYMTYEIFNRIVAVLLALQACSLIAFYIGEREVMKMKGKLSRFAGAALMLYLPLFIASFPVGFSLFVAPSLASITVAGSVLRSGQSVLSDAQLS